MEGIETGALYFRFAGGTGVSRCPDMEGIETCRLRRWRGCRCVSVGAPTWRGLKPLCNNAGPRPACVSRCPDMEGIETIVLSP